MTSDDQVICNIINAVAMVHKGIDTYLLTALIQIIKSLNLILNIAIDRYPREEIRRT